MYNEHCVYGFNHRQTTSTWIWCFKKNGPQSLGKNVAGVGTKIHLIMNQQGVVAVKLTGAQVHDSKPVQEMLHTLNLDSIQAFVADKAYDFKPLRHLLNSHNIHAVIPNKRNKIKPAFLIKPFIVAGIASKICSPNSKKIADWLCALISSILLSLPLFA